LRALKREAHRKAHQQRRGDRPRHQPALRVQRNEGRPQRPVAAALAQGHGKAGDSGDHHRIGDRKVELDLGAAFEDQHDRRHQGKARRKGQHGGVQGQHHRLEVPEPVLVAHGPGRVFVLAQRVLQDQARDTKAKAAMLASIVA
jgi:hypothetical protein